MSFVTDKFILTQDKPVIITGDYSLFTFQNTSNTPVVIQGSNDGVTYSTLVSIGANSFASIETTVGYIKSLSNAVIYVSRSKSYKAENQEDNNSNNTPSINLDDLKKLVNTTINSNTLLKYVQHTSRLKTLNAVNQKNHNIQPMGLTYDSNTHQFKLDTTNNQAKPYTRVTLTRGKTYNITIPSYMQPEKLRFVLSTDANLHLNNIFNQETALLELSNGIKKVIHDNDNINTYNTARTIHLHLATRANRMSSYVAIFDNNFLLGFHTYEESQLFNPVSTNATIFLYIAYETNINIMPIGFNMMEAETIDYSNVLNIPPSSNNEAISQEVINNISIRLQALENKTNTSNLVNQVNQLYTLHQLQTIRKLTPKVLKPYTGTAISTDRYINADKGVVNFDASFTYDDDGNSIGRRQGHIKFSIENNISYNLKLPFMSYYNDNFQIVLSSNPNLTAPPPYNSNDGMYDPMLLWTERHDGETYYYYQDNLNLTYDDTGNLQYFSDNKRFLVDTFNSLEFKVAPSDSYILLYHNTNTNLQQRNTNTLTSSLDIDTSATNYLYVFFDVEELSLTLTQIT